MNFTFVRLLLHCVNRPKREEKNLFYELVATSIDSTISFTTTPNYMLIPLIIEKKLRMNAEYSERN